MTITTVKQGNLIRVAGDYGDMDKLATLVIPNLRFLGDKVQIEDRTCKVIYL